MVKLPKWVVPDTFPALFDTDSATCIEMTAKLYGAMNELIDDYNAFVDRINEEIEAFETLTEKNYELFAISLRQEFQDFIDTIDLKVKAQDKAIADKFVTQDDEIANSINTQNTKIANAISSQNAVIADAVIYMKTNLTATLNSVIAEMKTNGEFSAEVLKVFAVMVNDINALSARMDTFTKLAEGSTTADAELIDIRNGYDGTVYETAGEAVRAQIGKLSGEKVDKQTLVLSNNRLDPNGVMTGWFLNTNNGELYGYNEGTQWVSDFCDIHTNVTSERIFFGINNNVWQPKRYAFYDKDKVFISASDGDNNAYEVEIPNNAY